MLHLFLLKKNPKIFFPKKRQMIQLKKKKKIDDYIHFRIKPIRGGLTRGAYIVGPQYLLGIKFT